MHFYRQVHLAITDFGFYSDVFEQRLRRTLLFLLYLSAHVAVVLTLYFAWLYLPAADRFLQWVGREWPPFSVSEGRLEVKGDQPLKLRYEGDPSWTFVFDTTGAYQDAEGLEEPVILFIKEKLIFRYQGRDQTYLWKDLATLHFPADLPFYQTLTKWLFFPLAYSLILIWTLFWNLLQALLLSPLAFSVASLYSVRMRLENCFTIATYSLTPAITIDLAVQLTGLEISYFYVIYLATAGIYTYMASQRCALKE